MEWFALLFEQAKKKKKKSLKKIVKYEYFVVPMSQMHQSFLVGISNKYSARLILSKKLTLKFQPLIGKKKSQMETKIDTLFLEK